MAVSEGDRVKFHEGVRGQTVDAIILGVRDDGTVDLKYTHPYVADAWVEAAKAREGTGRWQWYVDSPEGAAHALEAASAPVTSIWEGFPDEGESVLSEGNGATVRQKITRTRGA